VAAQARDGEEVEAYVGRAHDTDVKVFDGEVESLSSAETEGVGVRVVNDSRQGFAYAGSLDPEAVAEALAEARDNAGFGTEDEFLGLPDPDGVTPADLDLFRADLAAAPASSIWPRPPPWRPSGPPRCWAPSSPRRGRSPSSSTPWSPPSSWASSRPRCQAKRF